MGGRKSSNLQVTLVRRAVLQELGVHYSIRDGVGAQRFGTDRMEDISPIVQLILDPLKVVSKVWLHGPIVAHDCDANINVGLITRLNETHNHHAAYVLPSTFVRLQAPAFVEPLLPIAP